MSDYIFKIPKIQAPFFAFQNGGSGPLSNQFITIVRPCIHLVKKRSIFN